ncbi:MAG: MscL family protein [Egibacteraceae bacterium]
MFKDYRAFLFQASLLNLAVAFILGAAFSSVVQSLAEDVIMAPIAGSLGFDQVADWTLGGVAIGSFLAALLSFVVIATVLFVIVRAVSKLQGRDPGDAAWADSDEVILLREIRDALLSQQRA